VRINTRTVWDRAKLDEAFVTLSDEPDEDPWGKAAVELSPILGDGLRDQAAAVSG
jgi:hypothetical protein